MLVLALALTVLVLATAQNWPRVWSFRPGLRRFAVCPVCPFRCRPVRFRSRPRRFRCYLFPRLVVVAAGFCCSSSALVFAGADSWGWQLGPGNYSDTAGLQNAFRPAKKKEKKISGDIKRYS